MVQSYGASTNLKIESISDKTWLLCILHVHTATRDDAKLDGYNF